MLTRKILPALLLIAALSAGCKHEPQGASAPNAAPTGAKITLGFSPPVGQKVLMVVDAKQVITQTPPGEKEQTQNQDIYMEMEYLVKNKNPDGTTTVAVTYKRMKMSGPAGAGDSAGPGTTVTDRIYRALCGNTIEMDMAPNGTVSQIRGASALYEKMGDALPELSQAQRDQLMTQLKTQFGEEALKKQFGQTAIYPDTPVDNGDVWHKAASMESFGMQLTSDYKLLSHDASTATVGVTGGLSPIQGAGPMKMGALTLRYHLSGDQKGSMSLDVAQGWTRKAEIVQSFSGTVDASGPGLAGTQTWPISIETTNTIETR